MPGGHSAERLCVFRAAKKHRPTRRIFAFERRFETSLKSKKAACELYGAQRHRRTRKKVKKIRKNGQNYLQSCILFFKRVV